MNCVFKVYTSSAVCSMAIKNKNRSYSERFFRCRGGKRHPYNLTLSIRIRQIYKSYRLLRRPPNLSTIFRSLYSIIFKRFISQQSLRFPYLRLCKELPSLSSHHVCPFHTAAIREFCSLMPL